MQPKTQQAFGDLYVAIFDRIARGQFRPSHRIAVNILAKSLNVSTTPVREVLRQLAGRDLLVERHREGFYLAPLNARTIASLYAAHGFWLERIFADPRLGSPPTRLPRNLWRLFDLAGRLSGDPAAIAVRRYLDDRLVAVRRHESSLLGDMAERGATLADALGRGDIAQAVDLGRHFHSHCMDLSEAMALAFDPER